MLAGTSSVRHRIAVVILTLIALVGSLVIAVSPSKADTQPIEMPGTGHWYQWVPGTYGWEQARYLADTSTFNGLHGHLANVTSEAENNFVAKLVVVTASAPSQQTWMGGKNLNASGSSLSNSGIAGQYAWVDGPEAGQVFMSCSSQGCTNQGYSHFSSDNPSGDGPYIGFWSGIGRDYHDWNDWNDWSGETQSVLNGYLVEFESGDWWQKLHIVSPSISTLVSGMANTGARGLFVAKNQDVLIADYGDNKVLRVSPTGIVTTLSTTISKPHSLVELPDGRIIVGTFSSNRLWVIHPDLSVTSFSGPGGESANPALAISNDGRLIVQNQENGKTWMINDDLVTTTNFTAFSDVLTVDQTRQGNFIFLRRNNSSVTLTYVDKNLKILWTRDVGRVSRPVIDTAGDVLYVDDDRQQLLMINPSGEMNILASVAPYVMDLAFAADGTLYGAANDGTVISLTTVGFSRIPLVTVKTIQGYDSKLRVSWDAVAAFDSEETITYTASAGSDVLSCSTTENSCDITGLTNGQTYSVTVIASDGTNTSQPSDAVSGMPGVPPGAPTGVNVIAGGGQAQVSWFAPTTGSPLSNLSYKVTSSPGAFTCTTTSTTCMVSGLTNGRSYTFSVVASTVVGVSDAAVSGYVTPGTTPDQVAGLNTVTRSSSSVTVGWSAPNSNGAAISDYLVRTSSDGSTWSDPIDTASTSTSYAIDGLSSATARLVQVAAKNSKGQGPWSDSFLSTTKGAKLVRVTVQDSTGLPVTGGAITWRMVDNSAWSSKTYGLTADGIIDFPYAPAGAVNVTLTNGQMSDGSIVSGSWNATLGFDTAVLTVPTNDAYAARTVHVQLPNGYPVANVKVTVTGSGLTSHKTLSGFTFSVPISSTTGFTDASGNFTATGYWSGVPSANTLYDDGIITQQQDNKLVGSMTNVELDYMPWVSFDSSQVIGSAGAPQIVQVSAVDSGSAQLIGRRYVTAQPGKAGVAVKLVPPKGVKVTKCANGKSQKLSGVTGANGKAKLTICAYESGVYTLKTSGAASVGSIRVLVKGAAPLAPTSVNVTSPVVGQLRASWNKPLYDGGSPVLSYTVTAKATGKPTVTKLIKATISKTGAVTKAPATLQVLTGLSNATVYTVTVTATTKNGTSNAYSVKVPVA